jgi:hypothetical protein
MNEDAPRSQDRWIASMASCADRGVAARGAAVLPA